MPYDESLEGPSAGKGIHRPGSGPGWQLVPMLLSNTRGDPAPDTSNACSDLIAASSLNPTMSPWSPSPHPPVLVFERWNKEMEGLCCRAPTCDTRINDKVGIIVLQAWQLLPLICLLVGQSLGVLIPVLGEGGIIREGGEGGPLRAGPLGLQLLMHDQEMVQVEQVGIMPRGVPQLLLCGGSKLHHNEQDDEGLCAIDLPGMQ